MAMKHEAPRVLERTEVDRIAALAHLGLTDDEKTAMASELGKILAYVDLLSELDLEGVPPTTQIGFEEDRALRLDLVGEELDREVVLAEAPKASEGGFSVPAFVDEG